MNEVKQMIKYDLTRYGIKSLKELPYMSRKELYGYHYTRIMRLTNYYKSNGNKLFFLVYRFKLYRLSQKYGYSIPYTTSIGKGLFLGHLGSIVINAGVQMGDNINIAQGVTIGYSNAGQHRGCPIIGDNVWIGTNSVIVGGIKIGNDVMIAPNTFVNFDVPDHSLVIAEKATIKERDNATKGYIENRV